MAAVRPRGRADGPQAQGSAKSPSEHRSWSRPRSMPLPSPSRECAGEHLLDHGQGLVEIVRRRNRIDFDPFPWESRVGN